VTVGHFVIMIRGFDHVTWRWTASAVSIHQSITIHHQRTVHLAYTVFCCHSSRRLQSADCRRTSLYIHQI